MTSRMSISFVVVLGLLLPAVTSGHCPINFNMAYYYATYNVVVKGFVTPPDHFCEQTMVMSATCDPGTAMTAMNMTVGNVIAYAMTSAVSPSCAWQCQCGTSTVQITIDGGDGLPVELMGFEVVEED